MEWLNDVAIQGLTGATGYFKDLQSGVLRQVHIERSQAIRTRQDYIGHCLGVVAVTRDPGWGALTGMITASGLGTLKQSLNSP